MQVGEIYRSNYWGDVEVIDFNTTKAVTVKFINTDNIYTFQKDAILKGLIRDALEDNRLHRLHVEKLKRPSRVFNWILSESRKNIKYILKQNKETLSEVVSILKDVNKVFKSIDKLSTEREIIREHSVYGKYKITLETEEDGMYQYQFLDSGYVGIGSLRDIAKKAVKDGTVSEEEYQLRVKLNSQLWYDANREQRIEAAKRYQKENKEIARNANRRRRAIRKGVGGSFTQADIDAILVKQNNKCTACGITLDDTKHLDHIMPVAKGGNNNPDNLQWLCQCCNNMKGAKLPEEWFKYIKTDTFKKRRAKYK